jgi:SAM-dependent methyltransferase
MPKEYLKGWVPTMNQRGFMATELDPYSQAWVDFAKEASGPVLDIGAAYGVASIEALKQGASVTAADMEEKHLDVLRSRIKDESLAQRLKTVVGTLPDGLDLAEESFAAILISRVLHFLEPKQVQDSVAQAARWLKRGGKLFLVVETPYMRVLEPFIPTYEARRRAGAKWPGVISDFRRYLSPDEKRFAPQRMNMLDPEVLSRVCYENGLDILEAGFIERSSYDERIRLDGREGAGIIAFKR